MEAWGILPLSLRASSHPWSIDAYFDKHNNPYYLDDTHNISLLRSLLQRCTIVYIKPGAHKAHP